MTVCEQIAKFVDNRGGSCCNLTTTVWKKKKCFLSDESSIRQVIYIIQNTFEHHNLWFRLCYFLSVVAGDSSCANCYWTQNRNKVHGVSPSDSKRHSKCTQRLSDLRSWTFEPLMHFVSPDVQQNTRKTNQFTWHRHVRTGEPTTQMKAVRHGNLNDPCSTFQ